MGIIIRRANIDDLAVVQKLASALFVSDSASDPHLDVNWPFGEGADFYRKHIVEDESVTFLAIDNQGTKSTAVGYICGEIMELENWRPVPRAELDNMYMVEECRGKGTGRMLIEAFKNWCFKKNITRITVSVYFANLGAREFYFKNGFKPELVFLEADFSR